MNDCCNHPTYKFDDDIRDAFNPTQVRLYGIYPEFEVPAFGKIVADWTGGQVQCGEEVRETPSRAESEHRSGVIAASLNILRIATEQGNAVVCAGPDNTGKPLSLGIIFGYAFEGQCYDLPKPKIILLPRPPRGTIPADDCGWDKKPGYSVWVVDKLEVCVEIEINQGFIEQIVLEANMPGKRSPSTYRASMSLSHRSGRLSE